MTHLGPDLNGPDDAELTTVVEWPEPPRRRAPRPQASDPALTAAEHYLRASGLVAAAIGLEARSERLARLLGAADVHARLALVPDEIAAEARDLYAQAQVNAQADDTATEGAPA